MFKVSSATISVGVDACITCLRISHGTPRRLIDKRLAPRVHRHPSFTRHIVIMSQPESNKMSGCTNDAFVCGVTKAC